MIDQAHRLAQTVPPLVAAARQVAGAVMGQHGRRRAGPGESFWQFRAARPGDSGRSIDWRQSARSDVLHVRESEWAAAHTLHLWCDSAPGMNWASVPALPTKHRRAQILTLALALCLLRGGERVGAVGYHGVIGSEGQVEHLVQALEHGADIAPTEAMRPHHGLVLASDFLQPLEVWRGTFKTLAARGLRGHLLQILDPAEEDFPYDGRVRFRSLDGTPDLDAPSASEWGRLYRARLADHRQGLIRLCHDLGWIVITHRTDQPPQNALLALFQCLEGRGR